MEAGNRILSELELGSAYSWNLAMTDLLGPEPYYDRGEATPYVFVCIGNRDYGLLKRLITEPGTDGTVRWAGCGLNCRHVTVDLTRKPEFMSADDRIIIKPWVNDDMPLLIADGLNHGTIMEKPTDALVDMVLQALGVRSMDDWQRWCEQSSEMTRAALDGGTEQYQQFVVRVVDERGDPVPDYHLEFHVRDGGHDQEVEVAEDVHPWTDDTSYRCFHVNLSTFQPHALPSLFVHILASSGSAFVGYHGFGSHRAADDLTALDQGGKWDAEIELTSVLRGKSAEDANGNTSAPVDFFHPFTTTLIEIRLNREPEPLSGISEVLRLLAIDG